MKDRKPQKKEEQASLYRQLQEYCRSDVYPLHMPGHKRRMGDFGDPFSVDITEVEGFDNLHQAEGLLKEAQENAAGLYGAEETFFLVNGSTAGVLSAIGACAHSRSSSRILMARNSHRSAYHALYLNRLDPVFLYPGHYRNADRGIPEAFYEDEEGFPLLNGKIPPEQVEQALQEFPEACAVFVTSPTYDGVVSDIAEIARIAHKASVPLIVDEAHGAHFGFHPAFPPSALSQGADLVIQSVHKTLPSLTQTALLHVQGTLADRTLLRRMLRIYQTSSPSYVLMASIDRCVREMAQDGQFLMQQLSDHLEQFNARMENLKQLQILPTDDPSRILIGTGSSGLSGKQICAMLRTQYHLEPEMEAPGYVLAIMSVGDDAEGFRRLGDALLEIDRTAGREIPAGSGIPRTSVKTGGEGKTAAAADRICEMPYASMGTAETVIPLWKAWDMPKEGTALSRCEGRISAEVVCVYPPGIPIVVPGERIGRSACSELQNLKNRGFSFTDCLDSSLETLQVLREDTAAGRHDFI